MLQVSRCHQHKFGGAREFLTGEETSGTLVARASLHRCGCVSPSAAARAPMADNYALATDKRTDKQMYIDTAQIHSGGGFTSATSSPCCCSDIRNITM